MRKMVCYCDKCKKEVENLKDIHNIKLSYQINNKDMIPVVKTREVELCYVCFVKHTTFIDNVKREG